MVLAAIFFASAACGASSDEGGVDPVEVNPSDGGPREEVLAGEVSADTSAPVPPGALPSGGIWVVDAAGEVAGVLVRRGSDDNTAGRAIYDLVTVYHPESGLFYELTMSDGIVRFPQTVLFGGYSCDTPVGLSLGACKECRSGFGIGLLHAGQWWRVRGGVTYEQFNAGSVRAGGLSEECVSHGTSSAKGYPVDPVTGAAPPLTFTPPLRFVWR